MSFYGKYTGMGGSPGGGGVLSLDGLTGALTLVAGTGISILDGVSTITISSTSSGDVTIGPFGSAPNANGLSINGSQVLNMQPADATHPGGVSITTQSFAGDKTFTGNISAANLSGTNTGDVTIGTANGLSLVGQVLSLALSSTSTTGALSSTDWNTFNNKQPAGSYITALTGDVTATGPGSVAATLATVNGNVGTFGTATQTSTVTVNAKGLVTAASNTSIQIAESQVTNLVSDLAGKQPVGNYITALTGDATATGPGSVAITLATVNGNVGSFGSSTSIPSFTVNAKGLITAASGNVVIAPAGTLTGTTLASNVVSSSLTSVGTITSGTWNGTTIAIANGGTGQTTKAAAFDALSPMTTGGDLIYGGASGTGTRLANGTNGQVLTSSGTTVAPTWQTPTTGTVTAVSVATANGLAGSSSGGATPQLTLSTTVTGILSGNGTAISAASTTGSGAVVLATSPTLVTPALGTPSALVGTNITGTASGLTAGTVTTNANLTGDVTSVGNATTLATVNGNVGTFGTATQTSTVTVNAKGLVTAASNTSIQIAESQVTNLVSDLAAKQSTTLTNTHILVGNVSNVATDVAASGDLTLANTGAFTFNTVNSNVGSFGTATQVGTFTVNAKGLVTAASNTSIAIPFSQVSGTVPINQGGTGQTTKAAGFDALSPMTTGGDLIYGGASGTGTRLANGSAGQVLTSNGTTTAPTWNTPGGAAYATKTAAYTTVATDNVVTFDMSGSSNASYAVTLLTAVGNTGLTQTFVITAGSGVLSVNTTSSQTVGTLNSGVWAFSGIGNSIQVISDGTNWQVLKMPYIAPKITKFTSGTTTFTTQIGPTQIPSKYLRVIAVGAGGGGGGSGTLAASNAGTGGTGGNTTFGSSLITCNGGVGGGANSNRGGAGGTATLGTGATGTSISGGNGGNSGNAGALAQSGVGGGNGASTPLASGASYAAAALANSGAGGAGAETAASLSNPGSGGGAGGYINGIIAFPQSIAATFSAVIGAAGTAGTAGTSGNAGTAGGSGYVEVTEYYQ